MHSIVAFEVSISRIEGKFKLGQNRSDDDVQGVIDALRQSPGWSGRDLAEFMQAHGTRPED
jgi:transcriptional regulator